MCDLSISVHTLQAMCRRIGTSRALTVSIMLTNCEWRQLSELRINPNDYLDSEVFAQDALVTEYLRKHSEMPTGTDLQQAAVDSFHEAEVKCYQTNVRLTPFLAGFGLNEQEWRIKSFISKVKSEIADILGNLPDRLQGRLGPGATFSDKGKLATVPDKFTSIPTLTRSCSSLLRFWDDRWAKAHSERGGELSYVRGNRFTAVPKDSTKHRGICIEPALNVWFQLGLGSILRKRLKGRRGIDLERGQEVHRLIARTGSRTGSWCTIDLSSASDTLAFNLVKLMVPPAWFSLFESLRSPYTEICGRSVRLEKFSSMGCGFTFELETLIFFAICKVACKGDYVMAYGDDLIVEKSHEREVMSALRYFGFTPNPRKTFFDSPFRESCGGDYFLGKDVRAFYLKAEPVDAPQYFSLLNGLMRWCRVDDERRWPVIRDSWHYVLNLVPKRFRVFGPDALGDIVLHTPHESATSGGWEVHGIRWWAALLPVSRRRVAFSHFRPEIVMAAILYGAGADADGFVPRDPVTGYRLGRVAYS